MTTRVDAKGLLWYIGFRTIWTSFALTWTRHPQYLQVVLYSNPGQARQRDSLLWYSLSVTTLLGLNCIGSTYFF